MACNFNYMADRKKTHRTMTKALQEAIARSDLSYQAIEKATGVLRQSLMTFVQGRTSLRLDNADRLATFFNIKVQQSMQCRPHGERALSSGKKGRGSGEP